MLKKLLKISVLYIIFGIIISVVVSFMGAYRSLVILGTMGEITFTEYFSLMGYVALLWLPVAVTALFSATGYYNLANYKVFIALLILAFVVGSVYILKRKR